MREVENHKLTLAFELWPFHLDLNSRYPLSQVVGRMIHVAGEHATHFGYGIGFMMEHGATWVLSRMSIQFESPISIEEPMYISTGVTDWSGISTDRVITLQQGGEVVASSLTKWIGIDLTKRMPLPIDEILTDKALTATFSDLSLPEIPRRLLRREETAQLQLVYVHTVRYSDIDLNKHVNTSVWVSLAMDALPIERLLTHRLVEAHLRFMKEAQLGAELHVLHYSEGLIDYVQIESDEAPCFQIMLNWVEE